MKKRIARADGPEAGSKLPSVNSSRSLKRDRSSGTGIRPAAAAKVPATDTVFARLTVGGWLPALGLFLLVLAVYVPALRHDFISLDDNGYVTENSWVKQGITWENLRHAFRTTELAYWHPLTWISHLLDCTLYGERAWGHHLTSIGLHALNTALVFVVVWRMTGAKGKSWLVAALFGLHPLRVESVAWVAERKDVLSTLFWLIAIGSYIEWIHQRTKGNRRSGLYYGWSLLAFGAGLMSKPMVVTLPCLLLLLDYWPLERWGFGARPFSGRVVLKLVGEKIPFVALAAIASVGAVKAQALLGTLQSISVYPLGARLTNALTAYFGYLEKCFWPLNLAVYYPYPEQQPVGPIIVAGTGLALGTWAAFKWREHHPYFLVGWWWYLGTLVPVIGFVQVGGQAMADRYTYAPLIGIFIAVVWGLAPVANRWAGRLKVVVGVIALGLAGLAGMTLRQLAFWQNSPSLFEHALAVTGDNWFAHFSLGYHFAKAPGGLDQSIAHYREVVRIAPGFADGHFSLGAMLARKPESWAEAVDEYREALRLSPDSRKVYGALATTLEGMPDREAETIEAYEAIVRLDPEDADARNRLGNALARVPGRLADAVSHYHEVLRLRPDWVEAHGNLGIVFSQMPGRLPEAIAEYQAVLRARPDYAEGHNNLANALVLVAGHEAEAVAEYEAALRLRPDYFEAHFNFANMWANRPGHEAEAISHYEAALRLKPDLQPAREMIARLRARLRP